MDEEQVIRLDEEAKKKWMNLENNLILFTEENIWNIFQKDDSLIHFMKSYIDRHYKRRYPERFQ